MNPNIIPHQHAIQKADRHRLAEHRSFILWFTGLSGSGKSTLANRLEQKLYKDGCRTYILDGDNIRTGLCKDLTFSEEDRKENIRRIGEVAKLMVDAGVIVLSAFISPFREDRQLVRDLVNKGEFVEIFVNCPLEVCEQRDVKGLYQKARRGEIRNFTGIDSPFEPPLSPDIEIRSNEQSLDDSVDQLYRAILPFLKPSAE
ncbi:adenylylsulfate kinase [Catalinimonas alkaloidigena]|uniref:Adenylyl-sulfate kinase n=1 Tax=Catalinimonas alkaloidigena TaxID=1075417 RepID=A0A1G9LGL8_9BACT|nr:adenylyl-sulfate kinase [Catalinimonas alkaloidigena]SDL60655.1 adenylylsulfate kinase [Catalinimonas alkaloidigena]